MTVLEETKKQGIPLRPVGELSHYFQGSVAAPLINGAGLPIVSVPVHPSPVVHIMPHTQVSPAVQRVQVPEIEPGSKTPPPQFK